MWADLRFALRTLRKTPWFTAAAILILAVAVGANLAIFGLIDSLMLRSIPVDHPEELVRIDPTGPQGRINGMPSTVLDALRQESIFRGVCGFTTPRVTTNIEGGISSTGTLSMSGDCMQTLGVRTQLGRPISASDDVPEAPNVTVITARLWRTTFGASPDVLGRKVQAGSESYTVVGVAADSFTGVLLGFEPGLLIPLHHTPTESGQRRFVYYWVSVFARLAPGVSIEKAGARISAIAPALLEQTVPTRYNQSQRRAYLAYHLTVDSARTGVDWMLRGRFGGPLLALLGICGAILVIASLNLAGLLVARTLARQKEFSIRLAVGASRWRVMRPLAFESLIIALAGAAGGVNLASWVAHSIAVSASAAFSNLTIETSLGAHGWTLLAAVTGGIAMLLTAIPAWQARGMRAGGRGVIGERGTAQKTLIAIQVAFTLALVTASGVFASSFANLERLPMGFEPAGVAEAMISPLPGGYNLADPKAYYEQVLERVSSMPGVQSAAFSSYALYWQRLTPDAIRTDTGDREVRAKVIRISDGYFGALGVHLRSGEDFGREHAEAEAIVSESVARRLGDARYITLGDASAAKRYRVVGIAPTIRLGMDDVRDPNSSAVYLNFWQEPKELRYPVLYVKGSADFKALSSAVQSLGREYVEEYRPLMLQRDQSIVEDRLLAYLSSAFGVLALVLAAIGLFAILSCYVSRRTNEIGIRMALGATSAQIRKLVVRQIAPLLAVGIAVGLALAAGAGRLVASFVFDVSPRDPWLLGASVLSMVATALLAAWIPARRAIGIEPLEALRKE